MHPRVKAMIEAHEPLYLDLNPGTRPRDTRAISLDRRALPGIDILHDVEDLPWPLPDGCCYRILATHVVEFLKPWHVQAFMDECWRLLVGSGQLLICTVYAGSPRYWANPRHTHGWNEGTALFFDCSHPLWQEDHPRCWALEPGFPQWQSDGNLQIIFNKRPGAHERHGAAQENGTAHGQ
jgi:hypothetical protein